MALEMMMTKWFTCILSVGRDFFFSARKMIVLGISAPRIPSVWQFLRLCMACDKGIKDSEGAALAGQLRW